MKLTLQAVYQDLMGKLRSLPDELASKQEALTAAKLGNAQTVKRLKEIKERAEYAAAPQGKNDAERKAVTADILAKNQEYQNLSRANGREEADIASLSDLVDAIQREYGAVCFQATLHASLMSYLGKAGAADYEVEFVDYGMGKRSGNGNGNGHMTAQDAKEAGL